MSEARTGRPPEAGKEVIKAPGVRTDNSGVIGRPAPVVDVNRVSPAAKPEKVEAAEKRELEWFHIEIDLGPSTDHIRINDQTFHQGQVYRVREDLVPVLMETMYNTKMHEAVVKGQASPIGRRLQAGGRF